MKMKRIIYKVLEKYHLEKMGIGTKIPKRGVTDVKREIPVIISFTSFPERIKSTRKTIISLLNQTFLPDKIILWLAEEQFPNGEKDIPYDILELKKAGLEIGFYHDIKAYKKIIPSLSMYPKAIIVTVDDDWYYSKNMLKILMEEYELFPNEIICHSITHPYLDDHNQIRTNYDQIDYRGTSSFFNKLLGGSGVLFPPDSLDKIVMDENIFMDIAPTNDDIWIWAMAVKAGTKIRLASKAEGLLMMTEPEIQNKTSMGMKNCIGNTYENVTNEILKLFPEILDRLKAEQCNDREVV